eukprot:GEMP01025904.1.p1 GENE.GEMP01025904.1~~GEMP01025904.1.p1  ORF type:complete len:517 (-),score=99.81 GEMP01025904.1:844-2283(-)
MAGIHSAGGCTPRDTPGKRFSSCSPGCMPCGGTKPYGALTSTTPQQQIPVPPLPSTWNRKLRVAVKSLRFAVRHAPCNTTGIRMLAGTSVPSVLLPNGITRCWTRINPDITADWVWPSHFTPTLRGFAKRWPATSFSKPAHEYPEFLDRVRSQRVVLYLHGGAYMFCTKGTHRGLAYGIAKRADAFVLNLEYRRVPDTDFDGLVGDALQGYRFLLGLGIPGSNIVLCGDSAGGGLCCLLMMHLRSLGADPLPLAAALISPWVDLDYTRKDDVLPHALKYDYINCEFKAWRYAADMVAGERAKDDPRCSPLHADLSDLPPMLVQAGEYEVLRGQIAEFVDKVTLVSGTAHLELIPQMVHVPHMFALLCPAADAGFHTLGEFIRDPIAQSARNWALFKILKNVLVESDIGNDNNTFNIVIDSSVEEQPVTPTTEGVSGSHDSCTDSSGHSGDMKDRISTVSQKILYASPPPCPECEIAFSP